MKDKSKKSKPKKYVVDVWLTMARSYEVTATSREEAEDIIAGKISTGKIDYRDGFEQTEDYDLGCNGEENEKTGEIEFN